jgi:hypothetical protein
MHSGAAAAIVVAVAITRLQVTRAGVAHIVHQAAQTEALRGFVVIPRVQAGTSRPIIERKRMARTQTISVPKGT